jgi:hypothetical protein
LKINEKIKGNNNEKNMLKDFKYINIKNSKNIKKKNKEKTSFNLPSPLSLLNKNE